VARPAGHVTGLYHDAPRRVGAAAPRDPGIALLNVHLYCICVGTYGWLTSEVVRPSESPSLQFARVGSRAVPNSLRLRLIGRLREFASSIKSAGEPLFGRVLHRSLAALLQRYLALTHG